MTETLARIGAALPGNAVDDPRSRWQGVVTPTRASQRRSSLLATASCQISSGMLHRRSITFLRPGWRVAAPPWTRIARRAE